MARILSDLCDFNVQRDPLVGFLDLPVLLVYISPISISNYL